MPIDDGFSMSFDWRRQFEQAEASLFQLAAKFLFLVVLVVLIAIFISASGAIGFLAAIFAGLMLRSILPSEQFQSRANEYWTGEAGERWHRRWEALLDFIARTTERSVRAGVAITRWAKGVF